MHTQVKNGQLRASEPPIFRLLHDSVPWWLRVDVRERTRRAVCTHKEKAEASTHCTQQKQQQHNDNSSSSSTQRRRRRGSGGGQLRASEPPIVGLRTPCLGCCALFGAVTCCVVPRVLFDCWLFLPMILTYTLLYGFSASPLEIRWPAES